MERLRILLTRYHPDDRGVAAVVASIAMVVLVGFVGFAVDVGMVYNERRQEQSAVDAAALSAAKGLFQDDDDGQEIFEEVVNLSWVNMDNPPSLAQWEQDWVDCDDPSRPDGFNPLDASGQIIECISMDLADGEIRVRLPETKIDTVFARVLGFEEWSVSAAAHAGKPPMEGLSGVIPIGLLSNTAEGFRLCMREPPGGHAEDDCSGMSDENPGNDFTIEITRPPDCNGGSKAIVEKNAAMGSDHELSVYVPGLTPSIQDDEACDDGDIPAVRPNTLVTAPGTSDMDPLKDGLVFGTGYSDGQDARLTRAPSEHLTLQIGSGDSRMVDGRGLWTFINMSPGFGDETQRLPESCDPAVITDEELWGHDPRLGMDECFSDFNERIAEAEANASVSMPPNLFTTAIAESARFTWIPELHEENVGGNEIIHIKRFRPIFIQTLYFQQSGNTYGYNPGQCVMRYGEGECVDSGGAQHLRGANAYFFNLQAMLPQEIYDNGGIGDGEIVLRR